MGGKWGEECWQRGNCVGVRGSIRGMRRVAGTSGSGVGEAGIGDWGLGMQTSFAQLSHATPDSRNLVVCHPPDLRLLTFRPSTPATKRQASFPARPVFN